MDTLFRFVAEKMGGEIDRGKLMEFSWELHLSQLKVDLQSNIVPIGKIERGIHYHRALLYKVVYAIEQEKIKSSSYSRYYTETFYKWWGPSPWLSALNHRPPTLTAMS